MLLIRYEYMQYLLNEQKKKERTKCGNEEKKNCDSFFLCY